MVKSELIQRLCDLHPNILRKDITSIINIIFDEISDALSKAEKYEIRGYGKFKVKLRKARIARNPKTGEKVTIPEKKIPSFKMSKNMKLKLNNNFQSKIDWLTVKNKIFVAIDTDKAGEALNIIKGIKDYIAGIKLGLQFFSKNDFNKIL